MNEIVIWNDEIYNERNIGAIKFERNYKIVM